MIILKLESDINGQRDKKRILKRKTNREKLFDYSRSGIIINNKPHFVVSVSPETLRDFEFQKLLSRYKGSVVTSENLEYLDWLKEILFDLKPFKKKLLFESLKKTLSSGKYRGLNLLVFDYDLTLLDKMRNILPYVKSLSIITKSSGNTTDWEGDCFSEFGVKPVVLNYKENFNTKFYELIANFERIEDDKLHLEVFGEEITLEAPFNYLQIPEELKILENLNLSKTTICAAFNIDKNF